MNTKLLNVYEEIDMKLYSRSVEFQNGRTILCIIYTKKKKKNIISFKFKIILFNSNKKLCN